MRLVKQVRVVTKELFLVGNMRSQSLYEWLFSKLYRKILRYDPLNKVLRYFVIVPLQRKNLFQQLRRLDQGADHMRTYNPSIRQRRQRKCVLNESSRNNDLVYKSSSLRRYCSCKVNNRFIKIDAGINSTSRQDVRDKVMENLGDLNLFKKEILCESKGLTPLLLKSINKGVWPIPKYDKEIKTLVRKRQKYLAMLSNLHGFRSAMVIQQANEWLTKLDLRVFAIESVYKSFGNLTPGVDNVILKHENLLNYLERLKYNNLRHYKVDPIRKVYVPTNKRPLGIITIKDRIVQTLFVQVLDPIIDAHADNHSFGFRKGRNSHQAIGLLGKFLSVDPAHRKGSSDKKYFTHSKYILNIGTERFFTKANRDWLLKNYPFPNSFVQILESWLSCEIMYQNEYEVLISGFPQGSIIGPSLINFTLNGLEKTVIFNKATIFNKKVPKGCASKGLIYNKSPLVTRKAFASSPIRYADKFIVVVSDKELVKIISDRIDNFLQERGLIKNPTKSKIFKWKNGAKFDYLGFTFHYNSGKRFFKKIAQRKHNRNFIRNGLYVYPSKLRVRLFKKKIKEIINNNLNASPYRLILILNPQIRSWGGYFGIGALQTFSQLDHYIWYRIWRYLRRKYKKVSINNLVSRHFKGVHTPSGRTWQFHGIFDSVNKDIAEQKQFVVWLLLLSQLNKPVSAFVLSPTKALVESTHYIDESLCDEYNLKVTKLRSKRKSVDKWSLLYNRQQGLCCICGQSLGYLISENLEIYYSKKVFELSARDSHLKNINNLRLAHKSCYKAGLKFKE